MLHFSGHLKSINKIKAKNQEKQESIQAWIFYFNVLTIYFPKERAQEKLFKGRKYISYHRESPNFKCWCEKLLKSHICFNITCQIFAAGKGEEDLARNPGASYLEDKQERVGQIFFFWKVVTIQLPTYIVIKNSWKKLRLNIN